MKKNDLFRDRTFFQMGIVMFYYNIFRNLSQYFYKRQKKKDVKKQGLKPAFFTSPFRDILYSFILAKTYKEKGFITGMAVGLIFTCLITVVSFKYGLFSFNEIYLSKICAVMFAGILGGVVGVNI